MKKGKYNSGFTLVETALASFLIVTLSVGILGLQFILGDIQVRSINTFLSVEAGNNAVIEIARNARKTRAGENGSFALVSLDDNRLEFYSDIDFDDTAEKVTYFLNGTDIERSVVEPTGSPAVYDDQTATTKTIASNVQNILDNTPLFFYYNANWPGDTQNNPLLTPASLLDTKVIKIVLITNTGDNRNQDLATETVVHLRTLKDNL